MRLPGAPSLRIFGRALSWGALAAIAIAGVFGMRLAIESLRLHRADQVVRMVAWRAPEVRAAAKWPRRDLAAVRLTALEPPPEERAELADRFRRPDLVTPPAAGPGAGSSAGFGLFAGPGPRREILAYRKVNLPDGGRAEALVTLPPGGGEVDVDLVPVARSWIGLRQGLGYGVSVDLMRLCDQQPTLPDRASAYLFWEFLRVRRTYVRLEPTVDYDRRRHDQPLDIQLNLRLERRWGKGG